MQAACARVGNTLQDEARTLFCAGGVLQRASKALETMLESHLVSNSSGNLEVRRPNDYLFTDLSHNPGELRSAFYHLWAGLAVTQLMLRKALVDKDQAAPSALHFPTVVVEQRFRQALTHMGASHEVATNRNVAWKESGEDVLPGVIRGSRDLISSMTELRKIGSADIQFESAVTGYPATLSKVFALLRSGSENIIESLGKLNNKASLSAAV